MHKLSEYNQITAHHISEELKRTYGENLVSLAIFGSVARGTATPESDIDLLIVARNLVRGRMNRMDEFSQIEEAIINQLGHDTHIELSPIIKTPEEVEAGSPLFWDMTEDVIILFDPEDFLTDFLAKVKNRLRELKAKKVVEGNAWYWILKEDYRPGETFEL